MSYTVPKCAFCKRLDTTTKPRNLKTCSKCKKTQYCDRDCQKADRKAHKKVCSASAAQGFDKDGENSSAHSAARPRGLKAHIPNPFTKLDQVKYLHDRPETDVYKLLIDSFRMRQEDDFNFESKKMPNSIYARAHSSILPFRQYLAKIEACLNILPAWWTDEKHKTCETIGESGAWSDLRRRVSKQEIIDHYGDKMMPMQLRMLAESVYVVGTMGQDGTGMRKVMASMQSGRPSDGQMMSLLNLDMSSAHRSGLS